MTGLYIAANGSGSEHGLYVFRREKKTWGGTQLATVTALSALARHPTLPVVYGTAGTAATGTVLAWAVDDDQALMLSSVPSAGNEPCHLAVEPDGHWLAVANYASGSVAVLALADDGSIVKLDQLLELSGDGPDSERQRAAHPHQIVRAGDRAYVPDLGADLIRVYQCGDEPGARLFPVREIPVPAGTGPRHLVMLADGVAAVSGELRSTIIAGTPTGPTDEWAEAASTHRTSPSDRRSPRNYPGDIAASSDGTVAYLANRGQHTVSTFSFCGSEPRFVDEVDTGVEWPQHLLMSGNDLLIAGRGSSNVAALSLRDGIPSAGRILFDCPGAAWLLPTDP